MCIEMKKKITLAKRRVSVFFFLLILIIFLFISLIKHLHSSIHNNLPFNQSYFHLLDLRQSKYYNHHHHHQHHRFRVRCHDHHDDNDALMENKLILIYVNVFCGMVHGASNWEESSKPHNALSSLHVSSFYHFFFSFQNH